MAKECQVSIARSLNVNLVQHPSKYLGINFKLRGNRVADFQFLIDKLNSKLQGWKARLLSQASRTTLISFVLQSLPLYTFSCFKVPEFICNKMDSIVRSFWWGHETREKKLHLINWNKICKPKRWGGLGIKKFSPMNQVLLAKQYWRLNNSPQSLLARTFKAKYHPEGSLQGHTPKAHHSWVWKNIVLQGDPILREGRWLVGDGFDIPLTHPDWSPNLRYRKAYVGPFHPTRELRIAKSAHLIAAGQYQLIIKFAEARRTKPQRRAYAFVAVNMQGAEVFSRINFSLANTAIGALLEAMVEASIIAKNYGFHHVLFLTDRVNLHQVFKF